MTFDWEIYRKITYEKNFYVFLIFHNDNHIVVVIQVLLYHYQQSQYYSYYLLYCSQVKNFQIVLFKGVGNF